MNSNLTRRELFAAMAMQAQMGSDVAMGIFNKHTEGDGEKTLALLACSSVLAADALIAELAKEFNPSAEKAPQPALFDLDFSTPTAGGAGSTREHVLSLCEAILKHPYASDPNKKFASGVYGVVVNQDHATPNQVSTAEATARSLGIPV